MTFDLSSYKNGDVFYYSRAEDSSTRCTLSDGWYKVMIYGPAGPLYHGPHATKNIAIAVENAKRIDRPSLNNNFGVITDSTETWSPFDGKTYTSKAKMRNEAKARGLIELGNENVDKIQSKRRAEIIAEQRMSTRGDIEKALHFITNR